MSFTLKLPFTSWSLPNEDYTWQPVSKPALAFWMCAYAVAMYLYINVLPGSYFPFMDASHLVVHEAGHLIFGFTGSEFITIAMGTGFQLLVPLLLAASFAWRGHTTGTAFCLWAFFNSMINVSTYMKDARAHALPLVAPGVASDEIEEHDWTYLFGKLGLLEDDQQIGGVVLLVAWVGMAAVVCWLAWMATRVPAENARSASA